MYFSEHVRSVINSCAQAIHAIRKLRTRGMDDVQLQLIYRAIVIAKLTSASRSWWGFTNASDRHRLEGLAPLWFISSRPGAVLCWGWGGTGPPNVGQAPQNILVPTAKIRIVKI